MNAPQRTIHADLAAAGLLPGGPVRQETRRVLDPVEADFLNAGGWCVASIKGGDEEGGVTSHRGVLHPDEYVNEATLRALVEREFGFTYEQVHSVYRQGPLTDEQRELRGQIDARVLALSRAEANVALLGRCLGFAVKANGNCRAIENALVRARGVV